MRKTQPKSYEYVEKLMGAENQFMQQAREDSQTLGLDSISISALEANLISFQLQMINAKKVVEIGTLTGLSALHILQALPADGFLWTLEKSQEHYDLAQKNLEKEIKAQRCQIILGDARESLQSISSQGPFDAVFIDGNKAAYLDYFDWALANVKSGGLIIADNVFLAGAVWGDSTQQKFNEKQITVVRRMNQKAFNDAKLRSVIIPTQEGLLICNKLS
jgi:predicted O-methyltransferase YrrM